MVGVRHVTVRSADDGLRLDKWFKQEYPSLPYGYLQKLLRTGQIRVDSGRVKGGHRLKAGQEIRIPPIERRKKSDDGNLPVSDYRQENLRDRILFKDSDIIALNKPAGLAVQGGTGVNHHLDGFLHALTDDPSDDLKLTHRLDKNTSGVILIARHGRAARHVTDQFSNRSIKKYYLALTDGMPNGQLSGRISMNLEKGRGQNQREIMVKSDAGSENGKSAVTEYMVLGRGRYDICLTHAHPITGRKHQIRAHFYESGAPIVGDLKYHTYAPDDVPGRLYLHAQSVSFTNLRGVNHTVTAPLPGDFERALVQLGLTLPVRFFDKG